MTRAEAKRALGRLYGIGRSVTEAELQAELEADARIQPYDDLSERRRAILAPLRTG